MTSKKIHMVCPRCKYKYIIIGEKHEWEICPICGFGAPFGEFEVKDELR